VIVEERQRSTRLPIEINRPKLLLTEGADAYWFCCWAYRAYGLSDFQCVDIGGVAELPKRLKTIREVTGFEQNVKAMIVIRDADSSASGAADSIRGALRNAQFAVPEKPFDVKPGAPKTAFVIFPGLEADGTLIEAGTLEDLCLATARDQAILGCAESFLACCEAAGKTITTKRHKMKLHAYLAGNPDTAGMKLGEAAHAKAWDWDHPRLAPFKALLSSL
jgi:hypothetical protein